MSCTYSGGVVVITSSGGGAPAFPVTVTGSVSGGIPGFTSTTTEASSALLTANSPILGGGAGATPATATFLTTNGANQFNVGVVGSGSGCIGLVGTTSGTSTICGPNAGGGGGSVTNPIVFSNAIQLPALNTAAIQPSGSAGGLYMNIQDFGFISPTGTYQFSAGAGGVEISSGWPYAISSTTNSLGTPDIGWSRCAAGIYCIGNGNQGDTTGRVNAALSYLPRGG
jgi:hypothetical protein